MKKRRARKPCSPRLVKQHKQYKLTTPFSHKWGDVVRRKGSMDTVRYDDHEMTRDAAHFKLVLVSPADIHIVQGRISNKAKKINNVDQTDVFRS